MVDVEVREFDPLEGRLLADFREGVVDSGRPYLHLLGCIDLLVSVDVQSAKFVS